MFNGALSVGAMMDCLERTKINHITTLIELSQALSSALVLALASTPHGELSASGMDALTDLSYKLHLSLDQLEEIWAQASDGWPKGRIELLPVSRTPS
jgi:hypothetical protein